MTITQFLADVKERLSKAPPGPWKQGDARAPTDLARLIQMVEISIDALNRYKNVQGGPIDWPDHDDVSYLNRPALRALAELERLASDEKD